MHIEMKRQDDAERPIVPTAGHRVEAVAMVPLGGCTRRGAVVAVLALFLIATACSGSDDTTSSGAPPSGAATEVTTETVASAAWTIVDLGGDVEGFSRTVLALDRGYSVSQIVAHPAAFSGTVPDIVVNGEEPEGEPLGLLVVPEGAGGGDEEGAMGRVRLAALAQRLDEASQMQVEFSRMLLAELYIEAQIAASRGPAPLAESAPPEPDFHRFEEVDSSAQGAAIVAAVLALSARGYSLDQIVVALAAGDVRPDPGGDSCWYIPGEMVADPNDDLLAEGCTPIATLEAEVDRAFPADRDAPTSSSTSTSLTPSDEVDGVYRGEFPIELLGDSYREGTVTANEVSLEVSGGEVVELTSDYAIDGFPSEQGGGEVQCRSDATAGLRATDVAALADGVAEVPVEYTITQTVGVPVADVECDADLAGDLTVPLTARVTVDQGTAVVQVLSEGQIAASVTLTR